jgi:hypothetical protein
LPNKFGKRYHSANYTTYAAGVCGSFVRVGGFAANTNEINRHSMLPQAENACCNVSSSADCVSRTIIRL